MSIKDADWYRAQSLKYSAGHPDPPRPARFANRPRQKSPIGSSKMKEIALYLKFCGIDASVSDGVRELAKKACQLSGYKNHPQTKPDAHRFLWRFLDTMPSSLSHEQISRRPLVTFYDTPEWRELRYKALKRSRGCCELCGSLPAPGFPLHVDHIKPRSKYPALELQLSNLQVLCGDCNLGKSNKDETDWRKPNPSL